MLDMTKGAVRKDCKTGMPMVFCLSPFVERPSDQKKKGSVHAVSLPLQRWAVDLTRWSEVYQRIDAVAKRVEP
jgi:hypothetical protein